MLFINEKFLLYKLEALKNCKEVKHIMIMIIATIYIFFILYDIWSTVENYFQKIHRPPWKNPISLFYLLSPLKIQKLQVPPFCQHWKFLGSPVERREGHCGYSLFGKIEDGDKIEIRIIIISVIIVIMIVIISYFT